MFYFVMPVTFECHSLSQESQIIFSSLIPGDCPRSIYVSSGGKNNYNTISIKSQVAFWHLSKTKIILAKTKKGPVQEQLPN